MNDKPRARPCASCPYRQGVPSGVWHADEYAKLPAYDGETFEQPLEVFYCHNADGHVCAGWLAFSDPGELLAVRIGMMRGTLDPSCGSYTTTVPLFGSGREAADHGMADIDHPTPAALALAAKITRKRNL